MKIEESSQNDFSPTPASYKRRSGIYEYELETKNLFSIKTALNPLGSLIAAIRKYGESLADYLPFLLQLIESENIYIIALWTGAQIATTLIPSLKLYYTGEMLRLAEKAVEQRMIDKGEFYAVGLKTLIASVVAIIVRWIKVTTEQKLSQSLSRGFILRLIKAHIKMSASNFDDPEVQKLLLTLGVGRQYQGSSRPLINFAQLTHGLTSGLVVLSLVAQLSVLYRMVGKEDVIYVVMAGTSFWISDMTSFFEGRIIWTKIISEPYLRMNKLFELATSSQYKSEVERLNLGDYLLPEYTRVRAELGETSIGNNFGDPDASFPIKSILLAAFDLYPMLHFVLKAVDSPETISMSLSSLALIKSTTVTVASQLRTVSYMAENFENEVASVKNLFEIETIDNEIIDGDLERLVTGEGMAIEYKNVSFHYAGKDKNSVNNLSWKLEKGQLCVIVGINGGGKSTMLKLLSRLYDPSEGEILIDGIELKDYQIQDVRKAQAIGSQDYVHFPLSIAENIALGNAEIPFDFQLVEKAAKLGGAHDFITKLDEGYDTDLRKAAWMEYGWGRRKNKMLKKEKRKNQMTILSQGQYQRLALSRTMMRAVSGKCDLMVFDEPSASLDGKAEYELFQRLDALRKETRSTAIYVSHRLGGFVKTADLVLYMDEGQILEQGTHTELMKRGGRYCELYTMQASSFQEEN